jgi:hypothetical protein
MIMIAPIIQVYFYTRVTQAGNGRDADSCQSTSYPTASGTCLPSQRPSLNLNDELQVQVLLAVI